jgi:hypothetical protein
MALDQLTDWLLGLPGFQSQLDRLITDSLRREFPAITFSAGDEPAVRWEYLLLCGSLLAKSETEPAQKAALRIAEHCLNSAGTNASQRNAAGVILDCMANRPSIQLAQKRNLLSGEFSAELPLPLRQDYARRSLENTIVRAGGGLLDVNHFQRAFWQAVKANQWISVSAPTSAGKSFIIKAWIEDFSRTHPIGKIVYLVPTRALIQEVQRDLESHFSANGLTRVVVHTLPSKGEVDMDKINVFVFTQERFHLLLSATNKDFTFDILVVDEAQKIGDGSRGVLLQQVMDEAVRRSQETSLVFASPQTENPEYLLTGAPREVTRLAVAKNTVTVTQNLIWASQRPGKPMLWDLSYRDGIKNLQLGNVALKYRPSPISKRLSFVAHALRCQKGGNLIYVNGAADAEKAADQIWDLATDYDYVGKDKRIQDLIELVQKTIHKQYTLAETLKRGVAYHYGNMPLLVRTEIERLFCENAIPFLVCTSTLMEGVNLPCRVIFARGPQKGRGNNIQPQDFWNLAGRAGRWGKEFQGHIVCIDPTDQNVWDGDAPTSRVKTKIKGTTNEVLSPPTAFLAYINAGFPAATRKEMPEFDYVFCYLSSVYLRDGNLASIQAARSLDEPTRQNLEKTIAASLESTGIPEEVIRHNPGILPIHMQRLLAFFTEQGDAVVNYVPVLPESEDAVAVYERILTVIDTHLGAGLGEAKRLKSLAILTVQWMRGYSLARLIHGRQKYATSKQSSVNLQQLIRGVMNDVEQFARFQAPKFLNCYIDVLRLFALQTNRQPLLKDMPELGIYLEFGVSLPTQLALIGLGLSRTSALALSERIAKDDLDKVGVKNWLNQREWENLDIPELVKSEVRQILDKHSSK